ncbi:HD domain-containing protein [Lachnospiraceae bacterium ZAX-1]
MGMKTFAAIYIGSYEITLKIFELSTNKGIRSLDYVRSRVELGKDVYSKGAIGYELVEELCQVLKEFHQIMDGYVVDDYKACASSVLSDASNGLFILDQIRLRTKIKVEVLSNSEQRFVSYKSLASSVAFESMIAEGTAVVDVGGGSIQITLFREGHAVTTQHIVLGTVRIREKLSGIESLVSHYEDQMQELIDKELKIFDKIYLQDQLWNQKKMKYVIMVGDYISTIMKQVTKVREDNTIETERFVKALRKLNKKTTSQLAEELNLENEQDPLLIPSIVLYKRLAEALGAEYIWVPGSNISDGIAYDYAQKNHIVKTTHNFDEDVLSAAGHLAKRYASDLDHTAAILGLSTLIYDTMKKVHGMGKRERLILQVAVILHDCGRYISLVNQTDYAYQIIMASEIIGMTHLEREIVASIVKYHGRSMVPYGQIMDKMNQESYMIVSKLAAILKVANALDRSHKQKFKNVKAVLREKQLTITIESTEDILLEKGLFYTYTDRFEEIFSVKPLIKEKRVFE